MFHVYIEDKTSIFSTQKKKIGHYSLEVHPLVEGGVLTHSNIHEAYRGEGRGKALYVEMIKFALDKGYHVYSCDIWLEMPNPYMSVSARRVWQSLMRDQPFERHRVIRQRNCFKLEKCK